MTFLLNNSKNYKYTIVVWRRWRRLRRYSVSGYVVSCECAFYIRVFMCMRAFGVLLLLLDSDLLYLCFATVCKIRTKNSCFYLQMIVVICERERFFSNKPLSAKTAQNRLMYLFSLEEVLGLESTDRRKNLHMPWKYWMEMSQKEVRKNLK